MNAARDRLQVAKNAVALLERSRQPRIQIDQPPPAPFQAGPEVSPLTTVTAAELCAGGVEPIDYIVRPIVSRGAFVVPYGAPKVGKTTFVAHLVQATLDPTWHFLDGAQQMNCALWLDLDQPRRVSMRRFAEAGANPRLHVYRGQTPGLASLLATIDALGVDLLVVDSLSKWLMLEQENDNSELNRKLVPIQAALQERDVTTIAIAHAGKMDAPSGRNLRGASALLATVDIAIEMKAEGPLPDGRRRLSLTSREELVPDLIVKLKDGQYQLEGSARAVAVSANAERILKGIRFGHNRKDTLAVYLHVSEKTLEGWIAPLIEAGTVRFTKANERGARIIYSAGDSQNFLGSSEEGAGVLS